MMTEEQITRALSGDEQAFADVYNAYRNDVYRAARTILATVEDAEDVVQDTFIRAYRNRDKLNDPAKFSSWIVAIARNRARDVMRKKSAIPFADVEVTSPEGEEDFSLEDTIPETRADSIPEDAYSIKEREEMLHSLLDDLSSEQRLAVEMIYFEEKTYRDAAEELGINENTLKSRVFGAKKQITKKVRELEKQGVKLFSASPMGFFLWLLHSQTAAVVAPVTTAMLTGAAAGGAVLGGAALAEAGGTAVSGAVKAGFFTLHPLLTKTAAGILALALIGGAGAAIWSNTQKGRGAEAAVETTVETEEDTEEITSQLETLTETEENTEETDAKETAAVSEEESEEETVPESLTEPESTPALVSETETQPSSEVVNTSEAAVEETTEPETREPETTAQETTAVPETTAAPETTAVPATTAVTQTPETTPAQTTEEVVETTPAGDPDYVYRNEYFTLVIPERWRGRVTVKPYREAWSDGVNGERVGYNIYCGDYFIVNYATAYSWGPCFPNATGRGLTTLHEFNGVYIDGISPNYGAMVDEPNFYFMYPNVDVNNYSYEEMKSDGYRELLYCQLGYYVNIDDYYNDYPGFSMDYTDAEMWPLGTQVETNLQPLLEACIQAPDWQP